MDHSVQLGRDVAYKLDAALLIYRADGHGLGRAFVTHHPIKYADGRPYVGEAQPLGTSFLGSLSKDLGQWVPVEIFPANVLVRTMDCIVWWTPPAVRPMFFRGEPGSLASRLNGQMFPHPALVFKVHGQQLSVRALASGDRPVGETPLQAAPYWNVSEDGVCCCGTMRMPERSGVDSLPGWERGFFDSNFTHALGAARLCRFPGGLLAMWETLIGKSKFPPRYLADARQTLRGFAGGGG